MTDTRIKEVHTKLAKQTELVKSTEAKYLQMCEELKNRERETQMQTAQIKTLNAEHESATKKVAEQGNARAPVPCPRRLLLPRGH